MMDKINDVIGKNIRKYRKLRKLTQSQLGQLVGVSTAAVSNWERGTNSIDIDSLFAVCAVLHVPLSVMTDEDAPVVLSDLEKELLLKFRNGNDWQKITVIKCLDMEQIPVHLAKYIELFQEKNAPHLKNQDDK
jgi:transcriptional regulator with XRE-family HTH domain